MPDYIENSLFLIVECNMALFQSPLHNDKWFTAVKCILNWCLLRTWQNFSTALGWGSPSDYNLTHTVRQQRWSSKITRCGQDGQRFFVISPIQRVTVPSIQAGSVTSLTSNTQWTQNCARFLSLVLIIINHLRGSPDKFLLLLIYVSQLNFSLLKQ